MRGKSNDTARRSGRSKRRSRSAVAITAEEARRVARADLERIDATTDDDIARQIAADPDTAPVMSDEEWEQVVAASKQPPREQIAFKVDRDVLEFFKSDGAGYQTRMHAVLRAHMRNVLAKRRK